MGMLFCLMLNSENVNQLNTIKLVGIWLVCKNILYLD